ncbi:MAG: DUF4365 domain-containing protein [Pirellulaceae bacterium]|jgi:hypothetical protein|nr:DUF4365 domain-containing protein [Pirellulaceae bacterium]
MPIRIRRTREHVIEDLSENFLEQLVLIRGHLLRRPSRDYGVDVTMFHFAENGELENGEVRFQLKASQRLKLISSGKFISISIKSSDLHYWSMEYYPFILVVYNAIENRAFWVDVQEYVSQNSEGIDFDQQTINVHVPTLNCLTLDAIDLFRSKSLSAVEANKRTGGKKDGRRQ